MSNKSVVENHLIINLINDILNKQNKKDKKQLINAKYMKLYSLSFIENFEFLNKELNLKKIII
jgi:hypothetical protein